MKSRSEDARPAPTTRRACLLRLAAAGAACIAAAPFQVKATPLARVRERGTLSVGVYQDCPMEPGALAAQTAARRCATDLPYNLDGQVLTSGTLAPMLPARSDTELSPPTVDVALGSYHLTVFRGKNGQVTIVRAPRCSTT